MTRRPLRPLAGVIRARDRGEDPDEIEAHRRAERLQAARAQERRRAEWRLILLGAAMLGAFAAATANMTRMALSGPEPAAEAELRQVRAERADIVDRHGRLLATNMPTVGLYVEPNRIVDPAHAARELARIFPDLEAAALEERIRRNRFFFVRQTLSPEQAQRVWDIGEPGLRFARREMRLYPAGAAVAHLIGATGYGVLEVSAAEIVGTAGVERWFDRRLADPARVGEPLRLSIDLAAQIALRDQLLAGIARYNARAAAGVLMDARNGEVLALVSLPDFDPNARPQDPKDPRLFNMAAQGVYELGSTMKTVTAALALERGIARPDTLVNTTAPLVWGRHQIREAHRMPPRMTLRDVVVESSNTGAARLAAAAGAVWQKDLLERLGFFAPQTIELPEAAQAQPLRPARWPEISVMTVGFGHGLSVTPVHLAAAYATLANGGLLVRPTLLLGAEPPAEADRVVSAATSREIRDMLRAVVTRGTAKTADVPGYLVGGKTGTAEKITRGRYDPTRTLVTFAAIFPSDAPAYVLVVSLDEASVFAAGRIRRTAGWTAAPLAGETIRRLAPILGLRPVPGTAPTAPATIQVRN